MTELLSTDVAWDQDREARVRRQLWDIPGYVPVDDDCCGGCPPNVAKCETTEGPPRAYQLAVAWNGLQHDASRCEYTEVPVPTIGRMKAEPKEQYAGGATRSDRTGKGRFDLISPYALLRLARRYEDGAAHHGDRNWEGGFPLSRCYDAAIRHLTQALAGQTDEDHLAAAAWNVFAAMHFEALIERGVLPRGLDDIPQRTEV